MGVINVTPDSFSDGDRFPTVAAAVERRAGAMVEAGAAVIDIGGESTRPGAERRPGGTRRWTSVLPVIEGLRGCDAVISVDTSKAAVARGGHRGGGAGHGQ